MKISNYEINYKYNNNNEKKKKKKKTKVVYFVIELNVYLFVY